MRRRARRSSRISKGGSRPCAARPPAGGGSAFSSCWAPARSTPRGTSYIDSLLAYANAVNVAHGLRLAWPSYSAERLEAEQPDVLVVPQLTELPDAPPWNHLEAVRRGRIVRLDDDDLLRPGPRVAAVLDALAAHLAQYR